MFKVLFWTGKVQPCEVRWSADRSCEPRQGVIEVKCGEVTYGAAGQSDLGRGAILVLLGFVRSCPDRLSNVRHAVIAALRGFALYGTVLSCPVSGGEARFCEAVRSKLSSWFRGVRMGGARFAGVRHGFIALGSGPAGSSGAWLCKVLLWPGESCFVEGGRLVYCTVWLYFGVEWFCSVTSCFVW
jgi:hypothetical protein